MNDWLTLLRDELRIEWLKDSPTAVPFQLTGVDVGLWRAGRLERVGDRRWRLTAGTSEGLEAVWEAACFPDTRAVECWGAVTNRGATPVRGITECLTLAVDLLPDPAFGWPWARSVNGTDKIPTYFPPHDFAVVDRQLVNTPQAYYPLTLTGLEDGRSSGRNLPCLIVGDERGTRGLALFLEWSGLWRISASQRRIVHSRKVWDAKPELCLQIGLSGLALDLAPGESLPLPRVLVTAYDGDLEAGGNSLRRHIRRHVTPKLGGQEPLPPASFNSWFSFGNGFTAETLKPAVTACAEAGLEYFVVDTGWFEGAFRKGIGNWELVDRAKFPEGMRPFADFVRAAGMQYGTWFEPEWAHKDSRLVREHPDWFWTAGGDYHVMNLGLAEAREWWLRLIRRAYDDWGVRWIRWDFNEGPRAHWEAGVPAGRIGWRQIEHITGLYRLLDEILAACPELFIEQCASGGYRIDLGTARRGHSYWMNDHTTHSDIIRALQQGLNTVLPGNYANTNLCLNRHDLTDYDFLSHGCGGFGYSGRLWEAPREDFLRLKAAVERFKRYRPALLGDYHRPTDQPRRADEYAKVLFADGPHSVTMEFNPPGHPRGALCTTG